MAVMAQTKQRVISTRALYGAKAVLWNQEVVEKEVRSKVGRSLQKLELLRG